VSADGPSAPRQAGTVAFSRFAPSADGTSAFPALGSLVICTYAND